MDPARLISAVCAAPGRGPCTDAERRTASLLHDALRAAGHEVWVETEWVRPQWAGALALGALMAVVGSLLSVELPVSGLVLTGIAAIGLVWEATGRPGPLRWVFPRRATQNVIVLPRDPERIALLICARTDAPRRALIFATPLRRLAARLPGGPRAWLAAAAVLTAVTAGLRVADADGAGLGVAQFVPTLLLLIAFSAAIDAAIGAFSPGANDSASAVAAAVTLHGELVNTEPDRLSPGLVLHGAGEMDPLALRRMLRRERRRAEETVLVEVGPSGVGAPAYWTQHRQVERAAAAATQVVGARRLPRVVVAARRLPTLRVEARERGIVPHSRQAGDVPDVIAPGTLDEVVDFALAAVDALDGELNAD